MPVWKPECDAVFPSPSQLALLRAACCDRTEARESFRRWKALTGFSQYSDIDFSSSRLLPAVYQNLRRHDLSDPWLAQMGALHRYHWLRNVSSQRGVLEVAELFTREGIRFVLVGDFSLLATGIYSDLGERPFLSGELVVDADEASQTRRLLIARGWRDLAATPPPIAGWRSEWWQPPEGVPLKLQYRWLPKPYAAVTIDRLAPHARTVDWNGVRLPVTDDTSNLLYCCATHRRPARDESHRFLWSFGAVRILQRGATQIDWHRLISEARELNALFPLAEALEYLSGVFALPMLNELPTGLWEEIGLARGFSPRMKYPFYRHTRSWRCGGWGLGVGMFKAIWNDYAASEECANRRKSGQGFAHYWMWHIASEVRKLSRRQTGAVGNESLPTARAA